MPDRHLLLIPLPHGRDPRNNDLGRLSVLLLPRLEGEFPGPFAGPHHLADYPHDWARWPEVVLGSNGFDRLRLSVAINGIVDRSNGAFVVDSSNWVTPRPVPQAWTDLFRLGNGGQGIRVDPFRPVDQTQARLAPMYDAAQLTQQLHALFDALGSDFPEIPPTAQQLGALPALQQILDETHLDDYASHLEPLTSDGDPDEGSPPLDLHGAVALLLSHPNLLRRLGLIIDLQVRLPNDRVETVSVSTNYPAVYDNQGGRAREAHTIVSVSNDFWPTAGVTGIDAGWARIGTGDHVVGTLDLGSGVANLTDLVDPQGASEAADLGLADTAGIYIARPGSLVETTVTERFDRQMSFSRAIDLQLRSPDPQPVPIDADDVTIGLRYDVYDEQAQRWFSLWERHPRDGKARFPLTKLELDLPDDEGWLTVTGFTEAPRELERPQGTVEQPLPAVIDRTPMRISPMVFSWRGWSLAARPPGKALSLTAGAVPATPSTPPADAPLQAEIQYEVPDGVLPRLRYGRTYRLRARAVDLAGNSHPLGAATPATRDGDLETEPVVFGRAAPVAPPILVRRGDPPRPGWGDNPTAIVIRSELNQADRDVTPAERLLLPPTTAVERCLLHGQPGPDGLFTDQATFDEIVRRDASSPDELWRPDPISGEQVSDDPAWRPVVPYLSEVPADGVSLVGLPGSQGAVTAPYAGTWPTRSGVGISIGAGTAEPRIGSSPDGPAIACQVPKGVTRHVRLASSIEPSTLPHWSLYARASRSTQDELRPIILEGRHWMVSARAELTLIHAVRLPLALPRLTGLQADRPAVGDRRAALSGTLSLDVKSTERVEVTVSWTDPVDRGGPAGVEQITTTQALFTQREPYAEDTIRKLDDTPYDVGDTKRHLAVVRLEAFSRYARHFAERAEVRLPEGQSTTVGGPMAPGNVEVRGADGTRLVIGTDVEVDEATGRVTRLVRSTPVADDQLWIDYVPLPISRRSDEEGTTLPNGGLFEVVVPNSAVPDAVPVRETLAAFARSVTVSDELVEVEHRADVIRVWIDRPWFTTGAGELLGVVVDPLALGHETLHTRVARDPITAGTSSIPAVGFPRATTVMADVDGSGLTVHGHEVHFDTASQRWFADVELDGGLGYRSFAQLSVARFQPVSVLGAHLGETVMTEPIRFGPSRTVSIGQAGNSATVRVTGLGPRNRITVQTQRRDPNIADRDLGWSDVGDLVELDHDPSRNRWNGSIALPSDDDAYRLVVLDAELLERRSGANQTETVPVTVYVETIDLPARWRATPPPQVGRLEGTALDGAVELRWEPVPEVEGADTSYVVEYREREPSEPTLVEGVSEAEVVIVRLLNDTQYTFRVAARYGELQGPWSEPITLTPEAPPSGPTAQPGAIVVVGAIGGDQQIVLTWTVPDGDPEEYDIEITPADRRRLRWEPATLSNDGVTTDENDQTASATVIGLDRTALTNGDPYKLRIRATNSVDAGPWSDAVDATPIDRDDDDGPPEPPGPINDLGTEPGDGEVILSWEVPTGDITGYEVEVAPDDRRRLRWEPGTLSNGGVTTDENDQIASATVIGLTNEEPYGFRVRAVRMDDRGSLLDAGPWSDTVSETPVAPPDDDDGDPPPAPPGQVTDLQGEPGDDSGEVVLRWTEPHSGVPLTRYEVERTPRERGRTDWDPAGTVEADEADESGNLPTTLTVSGLDSGDTSRYRVRASNDGGDGPWSDTAIATAG